MRLRLRVTALAMLMSLAFGLVLSGMLLVRGFEDSLFSERERGRQEAALFSFTLTAGLEAFSALNQPDFASRAARTARRYMSGSALFALLDENGRELYSNAMPGDAPVMERAAALKARETLVKLDGRAWQLLLETPGGRAGAYSLRYARDITLVYETAARQTREAVLLLIALYALTGILLSLLLKAHFEPLRQLEKAALRVSGGDYTARAPVFRREDEVGQVALRFNEMASAIKEHIGKLEDRERAQRQFIADMAHEMKTPLTAIIGFSDLLRRHEMDGEGRQAALTAIASQGERLERLSLKLLSLSRLEGGTLPEMKQVKAAALFEQAGQALEPLLQAREVTLEVTERGQAFTCDPDLMASLLQNLLQNAVQASAPGQKVFLTAEDMGFTVRDEGRGIPREHLPRVKEPFYMADSSRSRAQGGAGLGLALCARIAELHRAQLQIDSEAGKGTTVQVILNE